MSVLTKVTPGDRIARPAKVLIPLIQTALQHADEAGGEYYREAGVLLREARSQFDGEAWARMVRREFDISAKHAELYMRWAKYQQDVEDGVIQGPVAKSISELAGKTSRDRKRRKAERKFRKGLRDLDPELFGQEEQTEAREIELHRDLAVQLIDIGFKALATRLHPDRGGSTDAMGRLNRVREQLKAFAQKRRFV